MADYFEVRPLNDFNSFNGVANWDNDIVPFIIMVLKCGPLMISFPLMVWQIGILTLCHIGILIVAYISPLLVSAANLYIDFVHILFQSLFFRVRTDFFFA